MVLAPARGIFALTCDGTTVLGITDLKVTPKVAMVSITADSDSAEKRYPTINDADFSASIIEDIADAGQDKIRASLVAHTPLQYVATVGGRKNTLTAYVESISRSGGPAEKTMMDVTFAVSNGTVEADV